MLGLVGCAIQAVEPFLRSGTAAIGGELDSRGDGDVGRKSVVVVLLELVWGEEDVGDGLRNEFLGGFFEGVAFLEDEPEGEGHFFLVLVFFWLFVVVVIKLGGCLDDSRGLCC